MRNLPRYLKDVKKIGFFGLGTSNTEIARIVKSETDAELILRSDKAINRKDLPPWLIDAALFEGAHACDAIAEDVLFLSPSVNRSRRALTDAALRGTKITSDAELFFEVCRGDVFAVSGSDGKSTTTELTSRLLSYGYERVNKSGNCGAAMTPFALSEQLGDAHAVELSSFMLEYLEPRTKRAVITGITENHLDWHGSFEAYAKAKENIYKRTEEAVIWADGETTRAFLKKYPAYAVLSRKYSDDELRPFGAPLRICTANGAIQINGKPALKISSLRRSEGHNIENFMSAMALAYGCYGQEELECVAKDFSGIEHRAESIGKFLGVEYIDSSIDSTPSRTVTTLKGLSRKVILILGGKGKGLSYAPLVPHVARWAKAIVLTGENKSEIKNALLSSGAFSASDERINEAYSFKEAVMIAKNIAKEGDTVLLSPASTSFDQFKNFEERAKKFKEIISK